VIPFSLLDQQRRDHRIIPEAFRLQHIFQTRRFLVEILDHSPGGAQLVVQYGAVGVFELRKFVEAILFVLLRAHRLGLLCHLLDRADERVSQFTRKLRASQPRADVSRAFISGDSGVGAAGRFHRIT